MTLPQKNRRTITVDEQQYFYIVSFRRSDRAVIQRSDGGGTFLFVFPFAILKPAHVAKIIKLAVSRGWNSSSSQSDTWVVFDINEKGEICLEWLDNDDFRVATYNTRGMINENQTHDYSDPRQWYDRERPTMPADDPN